MTPQPRMEDEPPYRWKGGVFLNAQEVKELILDLPQASPMRAQLRDAATKAAAMAMRLNEVDRGVEA